MVPATNSRIAAKSGQMSDQMSGQMSDQIDATLAALADPDRRAIVEILRGQPCLPSDIAKTLGISRPAMSRHLRQLKSAGLIAQEIAEADARMRPIRLRHEPFVSLRAWLDEVEAFWSGQLEAFARYAEKAVSTPQAAGPADRTPARSQKKSS